MLGILEGGLLCATIIGIYTLYQAIRDWSERKAKRMARELARSFYVDRLDEFHTAVVDLATEVATAMLRKQLYDEGREDSKVLRDASARIDRAVDTAEYMSRLVRWPSEDVIVDCDDLRKRVELLKEEVIALSTRASRLQSEIGEAILDRESSIEPAIMEGGDAD